MTHKRTQEVEGTRLACFTTRYAEMWSNARYYDAKNALFVINWSILSYQSHLCISSLKLIYWSILFLIIALGVHSWQLSNWVPSCLSKPRNNFPFQIWTRTNLNIQQNLNRLYYIPIVGYYRVLKMILWNYSYWHNKYLACNSIPLHNKMYM